MPENRMQIYGIGNPLIDILAYVDDEDLDRLSLYKGTMHLIDRERHARIISYLKDRKLAYSPGGSCPNTIVTLRMLGVDTTLAGGVGDDELGRIYRDKLSSIGLVDELVTYDESTGTSIILLTGDGERTMNTYLGANRCFNRDDVNIDSLARSNLFYFTGYMWDTEPQKGAVTRALEYCKDHGIMVAFDVADPFAVGRYRQTFLHLIQDYCDIVFANSEEARFLFDNYDAYECCRSMSKLCRIAVVKNGKRGSFVSDSGKIEKIPVQGSSEPVDTTGAGDTYAAGFLYGIANGKDAVTCGRMASYLAGEIISHLGAQFPAQKASEIRHHLETEFTA